MTANSPQVRVPTFFLSNDHIERARVCVCAMTKLYRFYIAACDNREASNVIAQMKLCQQAMLAHNFALATLPAP